MLRKQELDTSFGSAHDLSTGRRCGVWARFHIEARQGFLATGAGLDVATVDAVVLRVGWAAESGFAPGVLDAHAV